MYSTTAAAYLASPQPNNGITVPVPRHAPPDERRVAYMTLLADRSLRKGRSLLPTGEPTEALLEAGLVTSKQLPHIAAAYAQTCAERQARAWDAVPRTWTLPHGWQTKLGPARTQLVHALRAALMRNPSTGSSRTLLQYSADEMAGLCGLSARSIYRYLTADPEGLSLAELLRRVNAEGARVDSRGRRCPSAFQERLRNSYLALFVRAWRGSRRDKATGKQLRWKYWLDVLPVDPILEDELGDFIAALRGEEEQEAEAEDTILPICHTEGEQSPAKPSGPSADVHSHRQRGRDIRDDIQACETSIREEVVDREDDTPHGGEQPQWRPPPSRMDGPTPLSSPRPRGKVTAIPTGWMPGAGPGSSGTRMRSRATARGSRRWSRSSRKTGTTPRPDRRRPGPPRCCSPAR